MIAGNLNEIIKIEKPEIITDDYCANSLFWVMHKETRASVKIDNGNRVNENNEIVYAYSVTFSIRYYHEISEDMRIIWKNRKYRITSIFPDRNIQRIVITTELINE